MNQLWQLLRADAVRYTQRGGWARNVGFWIGTTHRMSEWAHQEPRAMRRHAALLPLAGLTKLWRAITGVCILDGASFGPGLCIPRARSMLIGRIRAGENCLISDHVTIGTNANANEVAFMGDGVEIGPGARILGPVGIGDGVHIGANAVVSRNVPRGAEVVAAAVQLCCKGKRV
jgi:serine O-acetyltransferase